MNKRITTRSEARTFNQTMNLYGIKSAPPSRAQIERDTAISQRRIERQYQIEVENIGKEVWDFGKQTATI